MKNNKLQIKDIPTKPILEFIRIHGGIGCNWFSVDQEWDNPRGVRNAMPDAAITQKNLVKAKMRKLVKQELVSGCTCGCRGDYELTSKGAFYL